MNMFMNLTNCKKGKHNLIEICSMSEDHISDCVVRWCKVCGAVVVDIDCDGRISPGRCVPMKFPKILRVYLANERKK